MATDKEVCLGAVERQVCEIAAKTLDVPQDQVFPSSRLIEDLNCDSLCIVELMISLEDAFDVAVSSNTDEPVGKAIFLRQPFRRSDLAEIVYLQQANGPADRIVEQGKTGRTKNGPADWFPVLAFTQLNGVWRPGESDSNAPLFESVTADDDRKQFRRRSDGMRCVLLPVGKTDIGSDAVTAEPDEKPRHLVHLNTFLMDAEPVSTTAYCRFLNSVSASEAHLLDWCQQSPGDPRSAQMPVEHLAGRWQPVAGTETFPIVLVSWFGANAYALWANDEDWTEYQQRDQFLPSEAQWEYAAQGALPAPGTGRTDRPQPVADQHQPTARYTAATMPLAPVHALGGLSGFGLQHMAGNVWQWCRDWYSPDFYQQAEAVAANPVNTTSTGLRSERGGSWVGPLELCRPTYRRGRVPSARGRCLGFRCVSSVDRLP